VLQNQNFPFDELQKEIVKLKHTLIEFRWLGNGGEGEIKQGGRVRCLQKTEWVEVG